VSESSFECWHNIHSWHFDVSEDPNLKVSAGCGSEFCACEVIAPPIPHFIRTPKYACRWPGFRLVRTPTEIPKTIIRILQLLGEVLSHLIENSRIGGLEFEQSKICTVHAEGRFLRVDATDFRSLRDARSSKCWSCGSRLYVTSLCRSQYTAAK